MSLISRRVSKGARMLDREIPGWWDVVDPVMLDLSTFSHCVLGQIATRRYPHYPMDGEKSWSKLVDEDLGLGVIRTMTHGFDSLTWRKTRHLERYWRLAIAQRKQAAITVTRNRALVTEPFLEQEEIHV